MIQAELDKYPRVPLVGLPSPLEPLPRLSSELDRNIFIKRDDVIGPAMGGNKARKLEYLIAEALARGATRVATFGGLQSNHARMTAAAARQHGLEPHLLYFEPRPHGWIGNLQLNAILGAKMHFVPFGGGGDGTLTLEATNRIVRLLAWFLVGRHYFIPAGGHSTIGCLGYVRAAIEIEAQARELGLENAWVVLAAGTGGTLAGLWAGLILIESSLRPIGIDVGKLWKGFPSSVAHMANALSVCLQRPKDFRDEDAPLIEGRYVGERYGVPSRDGMRALRRLAQREGILLDPIYTGKAFAGLIDLIEKGRLGDDEPIIFLHTGGGPGLFAFSEM